MFPRSVVLVAITVLATPLTAQPVPRGGALPVPPARPPAEGSDARPSEGVRYETRSGYTLAFVDADVRRVVDAVLGAMLKLDYSVDPKVSGNITVRTAHPVTREALLPLLEDAVATLDAAIVVRGGSYQVVPRAQARAAAPFVAAGATTGGVGYASEVVTLQNASAKEIARLLEQFLGKDAIAGVDVPRNQIVITGTAGDRAAARALIARFDVDALTGMNFQLYKLETVDPETLVGELERVFQPPFDIIGSRVRLVPLPRLHSVLAVASDRADIARIEPWIHRLDIGSGGKPKLYSYSVQNGRARDVAASLQLVLGVSVIAAPQSSGPSTSLGAGAGGSSPSIGAASDGSHSSSIGASSGAGGLTGFSGGSVASGGSGGPGLTGGNGTGGLASGGREGPRIVPNDDTNALLIYATGEEYELIREVLDKVDRAVPQVVIEATLAEVTLTKDLSLGVDWSVASGATTYNSRIASSGAPAAVFSGFAFGYAGATASAVLSSLQSKTSVKVLSAPKLLVLNNQTATLQVGDQVPIVTQQAQSVSAAGAPIVNTVELRDTGVILRVTPRVNDSGAITLDIAQEVSDVAQTTTSGINSPTIQQRRLTTTVTTRSGQMVALGGLIRDRLTRGRTGIPLLSQIPILGAAFGQQTSTGERTELIILITPTVLRSLDDTKAIVDELITGLDTTRPLVDRARARQVHLPPAPSPLPVMPPR